MGCAQTSPNVISPNHIPIERIYTNEDYSIVQAPVPAVVITAPPTPAYIKSALKKTPSDSRKRTNKPPTFHWKPLPLNKTVNFDEQVLVKARTPTPNKIWYEKSSSTMPMRKHRRNDDDDYDYDNEEIPSISSDEEQEINDENNSESRLPTFEHRNSLLQPNTFWDNPYTSPFMSTTNSELENDPYSTSSLNMNGYGTETTFPSSANRIKVRRKLPDLGPPQILPISVYQSPTQPSQLPSYQLSPQTSLVPTYQSSVQPSTISVQPNTISNLNNTVLELRSTLTNNELSTPTIYQPYNRHPSENII